MIAQAVQKATAKPVPKKKPAGKKAAEDAVAKEESEKESDTKVRIPAAPSDKICISLGQKTTSGAGVSALQSLTRDSD